MEQEGGRINYNFIPVPINFSLVDGNIHNGEFDLDKLLKKLKEDECVVNRNNISITDIPYYNAEEGKDKTIEFKYLLQKFYCKRRNHIYND